MTVGSEGRASLGSAMPQDLAVTKFGRGWDALMVADTKPLAPSDERTSPSRDQKRPRWWSLLGSGVDRIANTVCALALVVELCVILWNIVGRTLFKSPFQGTLEVSVIALATIAFVGGAVSYGKGEEVAMSALRDRAPANWRLGLGVMGEVVTTVFAAALAGASWLLAEAHSSERTASLGIPGTFQFLPLVIGMALFAWYAIRRIIQRRGKIAAVSCLMVVLLLVALVASHDLWVQLTLRGQNAVVLSLVAFALLLLAGVPIAVVLGAAALLYAYGTESPFQSLTLAVQQGATGFVLLALPFFVAAGYIMNEGGISQRLTDFVTNVIGHVRGGVLQTLVVTTFIVSGISGAKAADVAAVGIPMRKVIREQQYPAEEGAAVLAASAAMGELVPPSIAMLIFGSITAVSTATLFVAGVVPAAVIALILMGTAYVRARRSGRPTLARAPLKKMVWSGVVAVPALVMPLLLFGGILAGIGTPTEVSSFAVVYGILLSFAFKRANARTLLKIAIDASVMSGTILVILGTAQAFSRSLTAAGVPQELSAKMTSLPDWQFMLVTIVVIVVMGTFLEGLPALVVLSPLLLPVATGLGISPLSYAVVLLAGMGLGTFMPPVGVGYYVVTGVMDVKPERVMRPMVPYVLVLLVGLLVASFVPTISTVLPALFGMN